jgi:hypothetical protein
MKEFASTKDFSVGDLFLNHKGEACCYIIRIVQVRKGTQYEYELHYFNQAKTLYVRTNRIKDKVRYGGWKHIPVAK